MRIKVKKDFSSQQLGDFEAGKIYEVNSGFANKWIAMGLAEESKPVPILLQTKPEVISVETKPQPIISEVKKRGRTRKQIRSQDSLQN